MIIIDHMGETKKKDMLLRFALIGVALGFVFVLLTHAILFAGLGISFSFEGLALIHRANPFVWGIDFSPLIFLIVAFLAGRSRFRQLNELQKRIRTEMDKNNEIRNFANALIAGELNTTYSFPDTDQTLAESLNKLKDTLVRNRELEQKRRLEEKKSNWIAQGLASFGDILRTHSREMETMAYEVVSTLVRYLDANQGAIFIVKDEKGQKSLDMIACYAYERRKFPDRELAWGEGLIGEVAQEKKGYYTNKVPADYLKITSGLGKALPKYLLIEPLVWNEEVYGIVEIASFKALAEHQRQFVSRVAENIATTMNTMNSNLRTEQLLRETQAQATQLSKQEEQGRQNMEALRMAQEEAAKQAEEFISFTNTVNHTLMRAEYGTDGTLLYANTRFLKRLGYSGNKEVEGKHISIFINENDQAWFKGLWNKLAEGGRHFEGYMKHETKTGKDLWTMATYTCVRRDSGEVEKILFLAIDSTVQKKQSLDLEGQAEAIDSLNAKAVFHPDGLWEGSNKLFNKILKYNEAELKLMNVFDFFSTGEQERFNEIWEKALRGEAFQGQLRMQTRFEEEIWFRSSFISVKDLYGEVEKVVFLANDITREKEIEQATRKQHERLVKKEEELRLAGMDLKKKLEESEVRRKEARRLADRELKRSIQVVDNLPFPMLSINNQGFILSFNKEAEKLWKVKAGKVIQSQLRELFHPENNPDFILELVEPAKRKNPGLKSDLSMTLSGGSQVQMDLLLIRTDLEEELNYTLVLL